MGSYRLSKKAGQDLNRILDYGFDRFGLEQALAYYDVLHGRSDEIVENPFHCPAANPTEKGEIPALESRGKFQRWVDNSGGA